MKRYCARAGRRTFDSMTRASHANGRATWMWAPAATSDRPMTNSSFHHRTGGFVSLIRLSRLSPHDIGIYISPTDYPAPKERLLNDKLRQQKQISWWIQNARSTATPTRMKSYTQRTIPFLNRVLHQHTRFELEVGFQPKLPPNDERKWGSPSFCFPRLHQEIYVPLKQGFLSDGTYERFESSVT